MHGREWWFVFLPRSGGPVGGVYRLGICVLQGSSEFVVYRAKRLSPVSEVGGGNGSEKVEGFLADPPVRLDGERDEVWLWVSSSLVVFSSLRSAVCVRGCVSSSNFI